MTLESDIRQLIDASRESRQELARAIAEPTESTVVSLQAWIEGIDEALIRLAREIDELKLRTSLTDEKE